MFYFTLISINRYLSCNTRTFELIYCCNLFNPVNFQAPQPPEPWKGLRNATVEGSESISKHALYKNNIGSEDCLTLNVYTPTLRMIYIANTFVNQELI